MVEAASSMTLIQSFNGVSISFAVHYLRTRAFLSCIKTVVKDINSFKVSFSRVFSPQIYSRITLEETILVNSAA
jgi:aspartyl/asparaginyl beta-hydroxylase (cupin superfamily)